MTDSSLDSCFIFPCEGHVGHPERLTSCIEYTLAHATHIKGNWKSTEWNRYRI